MAIKLPPAYLLGASDRGRWTWTAMQATHPIAHAGGPNAVYPTTSITVIRLLHTMMYRTLKNRLSKTLPQYPEKIARLSYLLFFSGQKVVQPKRNQLDQFCWPWTTVRLWKQVRLAEWNLKGNWNIFDHPAPCVYLVSMYPKHASLLA